MFSAQMRPCRLAGPPKATAQVSSPPTALFFTSMASPTAQTQGSVMVRMRSSTFTWPRGVSSMPAACTKPVLGRTPKARITMSASRRLPDFRTTSETLAPFAGSSKAATPSFKCRSTPFFRSKMCKYSAISRSKGAITWSMASTMLTLKERFTNCSAISKPMKPPPQTTIFSGCTVPMCCSTAAVSSMVFKVKCPNLVMPGMALGTMASQPTDKTS
mmetsp:Transcript_31817/g.47568  ORF Transcript_31817/g.47568 Transcript_31817/m.47568 type:complete len:216 (+) Transcript_31817:992-1639(+)